MYLDLGTIEGVVSNLFVFGPVIVAVGILYRLDKRGFFGRR
jgi:hypothetical protein